MEPITREQVDALIADRISADPNFRSQLTSDPKATLADLTGAAIPDVVAISVHEETVVDIHLVIPAQMSELSDQDLTLVYGGYPGSPNSSPGGTCSAPW